MSEHVRLKDWMIYRPKIYALIAIPMFPILAVQAFAEWVKPEVQDALDEAKYGAVNSWKILIEAYREWPGNIYEMCEQEQARDKIRKRLADE